LDVFKPVVDEWLRTDLKAPRKQQHTARRDIFDRLRDEQDADVTYRIVREYVAYRRGELRIEDHLRLVALGLGSGELLAAVVRAGSGRSAPP
jgi:hypothetical protein